MHDEIRSHLEDLLSSTRLVTLLQPVLDLAEGRVAGYEALSRGPSNSPLYAPQALSGAASHHGLLPALDRARVRLALGTFTRLRLPGKLFVNLSPANLLDPDFAPGAILDALGEAGLSANRLVLAIPAYSVAPGHPRLRAAVTRLRAEGITLAVDDLGDGFAGLVPWSELEPGFVKIAGHFVADLHRDPRKARFVRSVRRLAEAARCCVIAEGVESAGELAVLKELGIGYAQGRLIGHPSPVPVRLLAPDVAACLPPGRSTGFSRRGHTTPWPAWQAPGSCFVDRPEDAPARLNG